MVAQVKHKYTNPFAQAPTSGPPSGKVGPTEWNDIHFVEGYPELESNNDFIGHNSFPTQALGDNTGMVATTAFVQNAVTAAGGYTEAPVDGTSYGRKNATWNRVIASDGDIIDGGNF